MHPQKLLSGDATAFIITEGGVQLIVAACMLVKYEVLRNLLFSRAGVENLRCRSANGTWAFGSRLDVRGFNKVIIATLNVNYLAISFGQQFNKLEILK